MSFRASTLLLIAAIPALVAAQNAEVKNHQQSETPATARFQVVQSSSMVRDTFRLDRVVGRVWQLVSNKSGELVWQPMPVRGLPEVSTSAPRFQIFLSSTLRRISLLVDSQTGQSWQLQSARINPEEPDIEENTEFVWNPIASE